MAEVTHNPLGAQFRTESIKIRGSAVLIAVFAAPVAMLVAGILDLVQMATKYNIPASALPWRDVYGAFWVPWAAAILPLLTSFYATSLVNLEHTGNHWEQLRTYPVQQWGFFVSKMVYGACLAGLSTALYSVGWLLVWIALSKGLAGLHLTAILAAASRAWFASWLLIPVQTWISAKIRGTGVPLLITVILMVIGLALLDADSKARYVYPWTLCTYTMDLRGADHNLLLPAIVGALGGIAGAWLVSWRLGREKGLAPVF